MPINFCAIRVSTLAALWLLPSVVFAQTPPTQPDIIGLKIGMTMDDAETVLKKYNPDLKIVPLYIRASSDQDLGESTPNADIQMRAGDPDLSAKVKIPTELIASVITHFYGGEPLAEVTGNNSAPVGEVSGEWFRLDFTPTDSGGRLYAVVHTIAYPPGAPLSPAAIQEQLTGKYGQPSTSTPAPNPTDYSSDVWMYDPRGRLLPAGHPDVQRCTFTTQSATDQPTIQGETADLSQGHYSLADGSDTVNENQYNEAFSGALGTNISQDDHFSVLTVLDSVEEFVPDFYTGSEGNPQARQCGIQVYTQFQSTLADYPSYFIIALSDQSAAFYDNGVTDYIAKKLAVIEPATSEPAPNL